MKPTRNSTKYSQPFAWLDLVFNIMMSFAFLFVLSYVLIHVAGKDAEVKKPKAEMLVVMTWPDYAVEDIDLWLKLPNGETVSFRQTQNKLIGLERDDRGIVGDYVVDEAGISRSTPTNKEIITFRGLPAGKYQVSVHYYSAMGGSEIQRQKGAPVEPTPPYQVKVEITKLNPSVAQVFVGEVTVTTVGEEQPVVAFTIDADGTVKGFTTQDLAHVVPIVGNGENQ